MIAEIFNHLWQSTLFAAAVTLLSLAFRRNRARLRYGLWFAASVKFLVPFAILVTLGQQLAWRPVVPSVEPAVALISEISQPFAPFIAPAAGVPMATASGDTGSQWPAILGAIWIAGSAVMLVSWWWRWRRLTALLRHASAIDRGRELGVLRRVEQTLGTASP